MTDATLLSPQAGAVASDRPLSGLHIGALDGVRGIAILLILAVHFGNALWNNGFVNPVFQVTNVGWIGVDLFFVLSGFLITGILYDSRGSEHYFRNFYARRALRIFPVYYLAVAIGVALSSLLPQVREVQMGNPLWIMFYLTNFLVAAEGREAAGVLGHFWSLAIEEHFYFLWPIVVLWGSRRQLMAVATSVMVAALALRIILVAYGVDPTAIFLITPTRIDALAAGALCSLAVRGPAGIAGVVRPAWATALLAGAAVLFIFFVRQTVSPLDPVMQTIGYTLLAGAFGATILVGIAWAPLSRVLNLGILRWFGRYSYGIYVWHDIIIILMFYTGAISALGIESKIGKLIYFLCGFALVLLVSYASYNYFEKRFLELKRHFQ